MKWEFCIKIDYQLTLRWKCFKMACPIQKPVHFIGQ